MSSGQIKVAAVKVPFSRDDEQQAALADMALLTGGIALTMATGRTLGRVQPEELGQARRVWADMDHFGIIAGKGDPRQLRQHITSLQTYHAQAKEPEDRRRFQERIGRISGGSAILHVGGLTEPEIEVRKENAERSGAALRSALGSGFVPGGGAAYLACQAALQGPFGEDDPLEKRAAYRILSRALEEPVRALLVNAGLDLEEWLGPLRQAACGAGSGCAHPKNLRFDRSWRARFCRGRQGRTAQRRFDRGPRLNRGRTRSPSQPTSELQSLIGAKVIHHVHRNAIRLRLFPCGIPQFCERWDLFRGSAVWTVPVQ